MRLAHHGSCATLVAVSRPDPSPIPETLPDPMPPPAIAAASDRELRAWRWVGHHLPALPHASAVINRLLKPWYLRRKRPVVVAEVEGFEMELDPSECVDGNLLFLPQLTDQHERRFLTRFLRPGDTFVDVGANIGFYALLAARAVGPTGRVLTIEADPRTAVILRRHLQRNGFAAAQVVQLGVSDQVCTLKLNRNTVGNRGGNSFLYGDSRSQVAVACRPLLAILEEAQLGTISCMKIDIEGFEHRVLSKFFADAPPQLWPRAMLMEYVAIHDRATGGSSLELARSLGYQVELRTSSNVVLTRAVA